jgi:hypothetical protein
MTEVKGEWINEILRVVVRQSDVPDMQLTILTRALAFAGKTIGVSKKILVDNLETMYDAEPVERMRQ